LLFILVEDSLFHSSIICKCEDCCKLGEHQRVLCTDVNPTCFDNEHWQLHWIVSAKVQTLLNNLEPI